MWLNRATLAVLLLAFFELALCAEDYYNVSVVFAVTGGQPEY